MIQVLEELGTGEIDEEIVLAEMKQMVRKERSLVYRLNYFLPQERQLVPF